MEIILWILDGAEVESTGGEYSQIPVTWDKNSLDPLWNWGPKQK